MYLNEVNLGKSVGIILIFLSVFFLLLVYGKDISMAGNSYSAYTITEWIRKISMRFLV